MLATADKIVRYLPNDDGEFRSPADSLQISDLKGSRPFMFTHEDWHTMGETVKSWGMFWITAAVSLMVFLAGFLVNFIATVFSAVAVMVVDMGAGTKLEFPAAMRLAAAFRIPVTILSGAPVLFGHNPLVGTSGWILWAIYLAFAIGALRIYDRGRAV